MRELREHKQIMSKLLLFILLEVFILNACTDSITPSPTITIESPSSTPTLTPTETITPSPSITLTPSLDHISGGWSTFYEERYGISFVYPTVFDRGYYDQEFLCTLETAQGEDFSEVRIGLAAVRIWETELSLQEYVDSFVASLSDTNWKFTQYPYSRDGNPTIRLEYSLDAPQRYSENTYIPYEDTMIVISYTYHPFIDCETRDLDYSMYGVYQQIVNTLKFEKK